MFRVTIRTWSLWCSRDAGVSFWLEEIASVGADPFSRDRVPPFGLYDKHKAQSEPERDRDPDPRSDTEPDTESYRHRRMRGPCPGADDSGAADRATLPPRARE